MNYRIEHIPNQYFAYMRRTGAYGQENYKLMEDFKAWANKNNLLDDNSIIYGIARDDVRKTAPEECRYDVGVAVENALGSEVQHGIFILDGNYMVFEIEHTATAVSEFWSNVFIIAEKENFQVDMSKPILERYAAKMIEKGMCEMCVPIQK